MTEQYNIQIFYKTTETNIGVTYLNWNDSLTKNQPTEWLGFTFNDFSYQNI